MLTPFFIVYSALYVCRCYDVGRVALELFPVLGCFLCTVLTDAPLRAEQAISAAGNRKTHTSSTYQSILSFHLSLVSVFLFFLILFCFHTPFFLQFSHELSVISLLALFLFFFFITVRSLFFFAVVILCVFVHIYHQS